MRYLARPLGHGGGRSTTPIAAPAVLPGDRAGPVRADRLDRRRLRRDRVHSQGVVMSRLAATLALLIAIAPSAHSQGIGDRLKQKVQDRLNAKADSAADKGL